ncbi:uncharacterized protein (DUF1800 family) [Sphingomonas sp. BK036]|uniref:DUF1800 domain-containing protein n=1 Tax=Sphingomonas sp. BK036 TaxID=2512122 RepID=UPI00102970C6|nr:DUF1800 domain-containing protein [Sphingomonas sp. BK036]RZT54985.1 uncharacterized protein (DUF1800 family) [Sphingomonas sp. BK036]
MAASSIALNRFGFGARPGDVVSGDPARWVLAQCDRFDARPAAIAGAPSTASVSAGLVAYFAEQKAIRTQFGPRAPKPAAGPAPDPMAAPVPAMAAADPGEAARQAARQRAGKVSRDDYGAAVAARTIAALTGDAPFVERLVHFWANHFAVSTEKLEVTGLAGPLEFEAIRPHVLGTFADMLNAVERHPAMLLYLDQAVSVGPDSAFAARRAKRRSGLNENLAREIMELHTLGVRSGYTQADVTEIARAMTGWTVAGIGRGPGARVQDDSRAGAFVFLADVHQPGDRIVMGKRYPAGGEAQAQAVLADLAVHPATATHIATKLARHFAGDTPPPAMVARIAAAFRTSGGDLPSVYRALVASPEAWVTPPVKFKSPWEWYVSTQRALGTTTVQPGVTVGMMNQLGQPIWKPGQPVGYDDIAAAWAGPDAILRRVEAAERFAARAGPVDARALAPTLYPGALSAATAQGLARAESPAQALALLLVAPESLRR